MNARISAVMVVTALALTGCTMSAGQGGEEPSEPVGEAKAAYSENGFLICGFNGDGIYNPSDPGTDLQCANYTGNGGGSDYPWSYSSDNGLNSWGWYASAGAVNWGTCLPPNGGPTYTLTVGAAPKGTLGSGGQLAPGTQPVYLSITCRNP